MFLFLTLQMYENILDSSFCYDLNVEILLDVKILHQGLINELKMLTCSHTIELKNLAILRGYAEQYILFELIILVSIWCN